MEPDIEKVIHLLKTCHEVFFGGYEERIESFPYSSFDLRMVLREACLSEKWEHNPYDKIIDGKDISGMNIHGKVPKCL